MRYFLLFVFAVLPCFAQDAKIMIVERSDSQKLAKAYKEYKEAQKHWEDLKLEVAKTYTQDGGKTLTGWEKIQFSADFRAIVPDSSQYAWHPAYCPITGTILAGSGTTTLAGNAESVGSFSSNSFLSADGVLKSPSFLDGVNGELKVQEKR
jgi:hypothetical protein